MLSAYNLLLSEVDESELLDLYWRSGQLVLWQLFQVCPAACMWEPSVALLCTAIIFKYLAPFTDCPSIVRHFSLPKPLAP